MLKITDFGMSRETYQIYVQKRTGRVPLKWMAIESIIASEFTSASDVWSYGIVLWEICTLGINKVRLFDIICMVWDYNRRSALSKYSE